MRKLLFLGLLTLWMWQAVPATTVAFRPGCGDGTCQSDDCAGAPLGTSPGDGCEECEGNCPDDCGGVSCGGEPGCYQNWVTTSQVVMGAYEKNWFFYCERWEDWLVNQHDTNECVPGQTNRTICDPRLVARLYGFDVDCCPGWDPLCNAGAYC